MNTTIRKFGLFFLLALAIGLTQSCKNKEPSVIKVFVRNQSNQLVSGAKVVIVGDVTSNPTTIAYVDTVISNESGFAYFNVESHYELGDDDYEVAYFDIIVQTPAFAGTGNIRSRIHTTAVETVYIQ